MGFRLFKFVQGEAPIFIEEFTHESQAMKSIGKSQFVIDMGTGLGIKPYSMTDYSKIRKGKTK